MRNCISYELTKKLAAQREKREREEAIAAFIIPLAFMICSVICLGIILLA